MVQVGSYCVYKHTFPNGKCYIGITNQKPHRRWANGGGYYRQKLLHKAIVKYGWDNITHEVLCTNLTKKEAEQKEIELIAHYKSNDTRYGYNLTKGGATHETVTEETKEKISQKLKNRKLKPLSDEAKQKISEKNKGRKVSTKTRQKISEHNKGRKLTEEWKQKISKANKGKIRTEEHKNNLSKSNKGKPKDKLKKPVEQWDLNGTLIKTYNSLTEAEKETGVPKAKICRVCKGGRKTSGGYVWKYGGDINGRA